MIEDMAEHEHHERDRRDREQRLQPSHERVTTRHGRHVAAAMIGRSVGDMEGVGDLGVRFTAWMVATDRTDTGDDREYCVKLSRE